MTTPPRRRSGFLAATKPIATIFARDLGAVLVGAISLVAMSAVAPVACTSNSKDTTSRPGQSDGIAETASATTTASPSASGTSAPNTPETTKRITVLFLGTSLTAGYGLDEDDAYPAVIEQLAESAGLAITAENRGQSGETSAGALRRVDWVMKAPAAVVVIETGANDALRGLPVNDAKANILAIVDKVQKAKPGTPIVLVQMEAPPNLGASYTRRFHEMYGEIAKEKGIVLAPFLLDGVAGRSSLNQPDGLHPNVEGARIVAQNIWKALEPVVRGQ